MGKCNTYLHNTAASECETLAVYSLIPSCNLLLLLLFVLLLLLCLLISDRTMYQLGICSLLAILTSDGVWMCNVSSFALLV